MPLPREIAILSRPIDSIPPSTPFPIRLGSLQDYLESPNPKKCNVSISFKRKGKSDILTTEEKIDFESTKGLNFPSYWKSLRKLGSQMVQDNAG